MFSLVSDLHLEFHSEPAQKLIKVLRDSPTKYLILAGDIVTPPEQHVFARFLKEIDGLHEKIFYVLGNHEYYNRECSTTLEFFRKRFPQVIFLENEAYKISDTLSLFGTTLWSDVLPEDFFMMRDHKFLKLDVVQQKHREAKEAIRKTVTEDTNWIVVTHHIPSPSLIHPKYAAFSSTGFASPCEDLFHDHILVWCYGHTHTAKEDTIGNTRFLCNPYGYPGENTSFQVVKF